MLHGYVFAGFSRFMHHLPYFIVPFSVGESNFSMGHPLRRNMGIPVARGRQVGRQPAIWICDGKRMAQRNLQDLPSGPRLIVVGYATYSWAGQK